MIQTNGATPLDDGSGDASAAVKKPDPNDPLAAAGLTIPGSANGPGSGTGITPPPTYTPPSVTTAPTYSATSSTAPGGGPAGGAGNAPAGSLTPDSSTSPTSSITPSNTANTSPAPTGGATATATPTPSPAPTPAPTGPQSDLAGDTPDQVNEYWATKFEQAGMPSTILPSGTPSTGVGTNGVQQYDPAVLEQQQQALAAKAAADPSVQSQLALSMTNRPVVQMPNQSATNLDDWWSIHGNGAPRYQYVNGIQVDNAAMSLRGQMATGVSAADSGLTPELEAQLNASGWGLNGGTGGSGGTGGTGGTGGAPVGGSPTTPPATPTSGAPATPSSPTAASSVLRAPGTGSDTGGATAPATPNAAAPASATGMDQANGRSTAQILQDLTDQYVTPGRQTTANNADPLSGVSTIDPNNDLRSTVITDTPDARTSGYADAVDQASKALPSDQNALAGNLSSNALSFLNPGTVNAGPAVAPTASSRLQGLQSLVDQAGQNLSNIDRFKLASDKFGTFANSTQGAYDLAMKKLAEKNATAGMGYSGPAETSYGDLSLQRQRDLDNERDSLFQQASADSVNDALSKENALSGLEGQLSGEEANQRGEQRQERDYSTSVDTGNVDRQLSARQAASSLGQTGAAAQAANARANVGTLSGLESSARGANQTAINDLRGERANQTAMEDQSFQRRLQQYLTQNGVQQQQFQNNMQLLGAGEAGNPSSTLMTGASLINPALDMQALQALAGQSGKTSVAGGSSSLKINPDGSGSIGGISIDPATIASYLESQRGQTPTSGIPGVNIPDASTLPVSTIGG